MSESAELEPGPFRLDLAEIAEQLLTPDDEAALADTTRRREFVERVARGYGTFYAGLAVGWSPAQIKRVETEPEMVEIVNTLAEFHNDTVEYAILRNAQAGNAQAQRMWALAKMPERGWVEKKTHVIEGKAKLDVVHSVKEALREAITSESDIEAVHHKYIEASSRADD
jgi:hypothetical protein